MSVVIPCFNAERWVAEAIESALGQTYPRLEVVVIDDGSTDRSLQVIQGFGERVRWETGLNRGGNVARNRGFRIARGDFVQFLDADDYLFPERIARQVAVLERERADVAYSDWRHQHNDRDGSSRLGPVESMGWREDMLESLLWRRLIPTVALLFRREAIERIGGWDESLAVAQDTDLTLSLALAGAKFAYQPECQAVYRRYGASTVSTSNRLRWLECNARVAAKVEQRLVASDRMEPRYRRALADYYFGLARGLDRFSRTRYHECMARALAVDPGYRFAGSRSYRMMQRVLGFRATEAVARWQRAVLRR